jgi:signal transduction histidine kinase
MKDYSMETKSVADTSNKKRTKYNVRFQPLKVASGNIQMVQLLVTRLIAQQENKPLKLNVLSKIFKNELAKNRIELPFKLVILKNQTHINDKIVASFYIADKKITVEALLNANKLLIFKNIMPAFVSLILILLSAGSLYYMWLIIKKQMQLDHIKNDFINNITHELRTPISILKTTNEALYQFGGASNPEKTTRYLQINDAIINKLDQNVDRILEITQYEKGIKSAELAPVNLENLITEILDRFILNENIQIKYKFNLNAKRVVIDKYMIETIISNLIDNSIKYTNKNPEINITVINYNDSWQIQISDNGKGISPEHLPFIFDKFYRVPAGDLHDVKGYGIGLSYVKQLVNTLKGSIEVKSKINEGTIFTIRFPYE